ncbi:hypothetical protein [Streptomyces sp. NRRL F-5630]|uniref:hypothetical protein n=1 Tax=Streptomyces sp. NRRL F-5630 TaxID=1463864 RepID=UPI003EB8785E
MSILHPLRPTGRRRAVDAVARLAADNAALRVELETVRAQWTAQHKYIQQADAELENLRDAAAERDQLQAEVTSLKARLANATPVSVPAAVRDIDPDDQPTVPTQVLPLWEALGARRRPSWAVTDPGQPGGDDTVETPLPRLAA